MNLSTMSLNELAELYKKFNPGTSPNFVFRDLGRGQRQTKLAALQVVQNAQHYSAELVALAQGVLDGGAKGQGLEHATGTTTTTTSGTANAGTDAGDDGEVITAAELAAYSKASGMASKGMVRSDRARASISVGVRSSWQNAGIRAARAARNHVCVDGIEYKSVNAAAQCRGIDSGLVTPLRRVLKHVANLSLELSDGSTQHWWLMGDVGQDIGSRQKALHHIPLSDVRRIARSLSCAS